MNLLKNFVSLSEKLGIISAFELFNLNEQPSIRSLSKKELGIYSRFTSCKRRCEFVAGRVACKKVFFKFTSKETACSEDFSNISVLNNEAGSPFIENSDLCVSISHSHGIAIASASQHAVGVDIEPISLKRISALKRMSTEYFSESAQDLTALWTLKESLGKALQTGIVENFSHYETKDFRYENGIYSCKFKNFTFSGIAITDGRYSISIVR